MSLLTEYNHQCKSNSLSGSYLFSCSDNRNNTYTSFKEFGGAGIWKEKSVLHGKIGDEGLD